MENNVIGLGVIGVGAMGSLHIDNLARRVVGTKVVALMDLDEQRLGVLEEQLKGCKTYINGIDLISDPEVDAVVIASADSTHTAYTLACLKEEKPVLCEKPLAIEAEDAKSIFQAEINIGRRLVQVGFMREYDPAHQKVKKLLESGDLGSPLFFRGLHYESKSLSPVSSRWQCGERHIRDVIVGSAIHDIHSAHWIMGQEIVQVYVQHVPDKTERPETCRFLIINLEFRDGSLGILQVNSDASYGYEVEVEVTGEKGKVKSPSSTAPIVRFSGRLSQDIEPEWKSRFEKAYFSEIQSWIAGVRSGEFVGPSAWDGYTSLAVADACIRSFETDKPQLVKIVDRPNFYSMR